MITADSFDNINKLSTMSIVSISITANSFDNVDSIDNVKTRGRLRSAIA